MKDNEYIKLLLDSAFKESERFWTRNTGFLLVQGILAGFIANIISESSFKLVPVILLCSAGILVSIPHILILRVSRHYNMAWYKSLQKRVRSLVESSSGENNENWRHLEAQLVVNDEKLPKPGFHSTEIALIVPFIFLLLWILIIIFSCIKLLNS
ncbi:hypothetical protein ACFLRM_03695 [Acidobacteriota bacterium]